MGAGYFKLDEYRGGCCQLGRGEEGKSPSMHGNPDADIMRDIVRLLRERIDHGLLTIFIKINLKPTGETPLMNKPIDGQMKEGRARIYAGPSHQIDLFSTGRTKA